MAAETGELRVAAVRELGALVQLALSLAEASPELRERAVRRVRCDLHVLGVTSEELDTAGLRFERRPGILEPEPGGTRQERTP